MSDKIRGAVLSGESLDTRKSPKWHRIYYLLALFDVLVVLFGLFLNHQLIVAHRDSAAENQVWSNRLDRYMELNELAAQVNAPGNDVFDSGDPKAETARLTSALIKFTGHLNEQKNGLSEGVTPDEAAALRQNFDAIEIRMNEMVAEAESIFGNFRDQRPDLAGKKMAEMDRKYFRLNAELASLRRAGTKIQNEKITAQANYAEQLQKYEIISAAFILLMVTAATVYGFKIKRRIEKDAEEKEKYIEELKQADESLREANDELEKRVEERTRDLAEANDALAKYTRTLKASNRELQDFAHVASHDLQEPLRKVQAFGERLRVKYAENLDETGTGYINRIENAAARMQKLIQDLLAFSRVNSMAKPFQYVDLEGIVREVISDLETRIEETGANIEIGELPKLDADPTQMRQLFQNLIGNALKFTRPERPPVIKIDSQFMPGHPQSEGGLHSQEGQWRITVEDNGIGFEEKYLDKIFGVFQRLHDREEFEGSGVGLSICRRIIERHQGSITAKSQLGRGAMFIVILPSRNSSEAIHEAA